MINLWVILTEILNMIRTDCIKSLIQPFNIKARSSALAERPSDASCLSVSSTLQCLECSLLLVISASDLPMRTVKFCSVVFGVTSKLSVINKITYALRLFVRFLRSTNSALKCYNLGLNFTVDGPAVIDAKTRYWSNIANFPPS